MAYSYVRYTGNGSTTNYTFSFPYISSDHIKVRVAGVLVTNWSFLNSSTIQFLSAPASGAVIEIRRETPKDTPIVNFTDGSVLLERDLDLLATYDLYLAQETKDGLDASISQTSTGVWDAQNKRVTNVADPVNAQDAVTKGYLETNLDTLTQPYRDEAAASAAASAASAVASANSSSAAASSVVAATTQANSAAASAVAAANSAAAAATALDNFDDRYLGQKATDPSVDNDGNALIQGALYFNTTNKIMRVYDGASWMDASTASVSTFKTYTYVATAGQTVFSGNDVNGSSLSFTAPYILVTLNGSDLRRTVDYTMSGGTSLTLTAAASAGDELQIHAFSSFNVANIQAANVSFSQGATGSATRSVDAKLKEFVSVKDFGAVGDGTTDDTAAIQACFTAAASMPSTGSVTNAVTVFFPKGTYNISSTLTLPRAFSNEGFIRVTGDGYFGSTLRWNGLADRIFIDGSNIPRLAFDNFVLDVKSGAGKPAYGLAAWGATGQHSSHHNVSNLLINGMKVGMACEQGYSYKNAAGSTVAAFNVVNGSQDSVYRNIIIESCDYGFLSGHTHNKYEQFRITCNVGVEIYPAAFGTWDNCYIAGGLDKVVLRDPFGSGATNLQNFNNCWFEVGGTGTHVFSIASNGSVQYSVTINCTNCNIADDQFLINAGTKVTCNLNIDGSVNWGAGGVSTTNSISADTGSVINTFNNTTYDFTFGFSGAGILNQTSAVRPNLKRLRVGDYGFAGDNHRIGVSNYSGSSQATQIGTYDSSGNFYTNFQVDRTGMVWAGGFLAGDYNFAGNTHRIGVSGYAGSAQSTQIGNWNSDGSFTPTVVFDRTRETYPGADNVCPLGVAGRRWSVVYAGTGTINTSDERAKVQRAGGIDPAVLRAWAKVEFAQYRFKDAVGEKGDGARWHFGVIAQKVKEAFESEGLDAFAYGLLCYDKWDDKYEEAMVDEEYTDESGNVSMRRVPTGEKKLVIPAGDRYGIRYEEALALECAYLRSKIDELAR